MPVDRLEHVNIRSTNLEASRDFYVRVLGLTAGARPPFASRGYWLYLAGSPVVHLVERNAGDSARPGSGNIDHIAFRGRDLEATRSVLRKEGLSFREQVVPSDGTVQLFVQDPDGVKVELNFEPEG